MPAMAEKNKTFKTAKLRLYATHSGGREYRAGLMDDETDGWVRAFRGLVESS